MNEEVRNDIVRRWRWPSWTVSSTVPCFRWCRLTSIDLGQVPFGFHANLTQQAAHVPQADEKAID